MASADRICRSVAFPTLAVKSREAYTIVRAGLAGQFDVEAALRRHMAR